jgi:hypothetical protein
METTDIVISKFGDWHLYLIDGEIVNIHHSCNDKISFVVRTPEWGPAGPPNKVYKYKYCSRCITHVPDHIKMMVNMMKFNP